MTLEENLRTRAHMADDILEMVEGCGSYKERWNRTLTYFQVVSDQFSEDIKKREEALKK